ncbi:MAG: hypothetical protein EXR91_11990 [Gemmatimonadetes bacterium]|nr:hypothetical protein [Gemmatimonadota bacterium]
MARGLIGRLLGVAVASCVLVSAVGAQTAGSDPILGTWKVNVERSVYSPGPRPPAELVTLREYAALEGGWFRFTMTSADALGVPTLNVGVYKLDGQRHPVHTTVTLGAFMSAARPSNLTRSYRVIDPRTTESTNYTGNTAAIPIVRAVSSDGRTFIETTRGTDAQGVAVNNVILWERVN